MTFFEAAIPVILYYAWQKNDLDDLTSNTWYKYAWKSMTYGGFIAFIIPFFFWCLSFAEKNIFSYLYIAMLVLFAGLYGGYITATTIIFQFQAIKGYSTGDYLDLSDIWWFFGAYLTT